MTTTKHDADDEAQGRHAEMLVDGTHIHWVEMGDVYDPVPVILLHGINDSHLTWHRIAPLLADHRRVLMPDLPGCGLSGRSDASYTLAWHAKIITEWMARLGVEQADVVGHSFGGGVAQMLLLERPVRVRRLALVASGGLGRDVGFWLRVASVPHVVERFGQPFMALGTRLALRSTRGLLSDDELAQRCAMNATQGSARALARTVRDVINWRGQTRHFMQRAHEIDAFPPMAVFWGDCDRLIPADQGTDVALSMEGIEFKRFVGCGHYLHHEQPQLFITALREFLDAESVAVARVRARVTPTDNGISRVLRRAWGAIRTWQDTGGGRPSLDDCVSSGPMIGC